MSKRGRKAKPIDPALKSKVVTVRMPGALYNALCHYSSDTDASLNQVCLDQLYDHPSITNYLKEENNVSQSQESQADKTEINIVPGNSSTG